MPKTPPIILPSSFPSWFNTEDKGSSSFTKRIDETEDLHTFLNADLSSFAYTPSDDDEDDDISDMNQGKSSQSSGHRTQQKRGVEMNNLYHKPSSNQNSQQRHQSASINGTPVMEVVNENSSEHYQLDDDDMDESQSNNQQQQTYFHKEEEEAPTDTQTRADDESFYIAIDQLTQEYQAYAEEYKEFKRHVDFAKRELLDHINQKTPYFEERGSYLSQKWESLKEYI